MEGKTRAVLERIVLPRYMTAQRWFGAKARTLETVSIRDWATGRHRRRAGLPRLRPRLLRRRQLRPVHRPPGHRHRRDRPSGCSWNSPGWSSPTSTGPAGDRGPLRRRRQRRVLRRAPRLVDRSREIRSRRPGRIGGMRTDGVRSSPSGERARPERVGDDHARVGRAEPHEPDLRQVDPAEALPPARSRGEPRLRDRPVPHREDRVPARAQDPGRARVPPAPIRSRPRWRSSRRWCRTRVRGGSTSSACSAATTSRSQRAAPARADRAPVVGPLFDLCEVEPPADVFEVVGAALRSAAVLGPSDRRDAPGPGQRRPTTRLSPPSRSPATSWPSWPRASRSKPTRCSPPCDRSSDTLNDSSRSWPSGCSPTARAARRASAAATAGDRDNLVKIRGPRRLSPRPGPLGRERLRDPRLRGRARPHDRRATRQEIAPARRRRACSARSTTPLTASS